MPKVTVEIDTSLCITAANCVGIAPQIFHIGDEPYAEVLDGAGQVKGPKYTFEATPEEMELLDEAVDSCPTRAIRMVPE